MSLSDFSSRSKGWSVAEVTTSYNDHLLHETLLSENTIFHYGNDLSLYCRFMERTHALPAHEIPASAITARSLQAFLKDQRSRRNNRPTSIKRRLACLRGFAKFLYNERIVPEPIKLDIYIPQDPTPKTSPPFTMTEAQRQALLDALRTITPNPVRDYPIFLLFLYCQLLSGEVIRLRVQDVDLRTASLRVTDSDGTQRIIPLPLEVHKALAKYLAHRAKSPESALFLNRFNRPITKGAISNTLRRIHSVPELRKLSLTPTKLRECGIVEKVKSGWTLEELQAYLGLKSVGSLGDYLADQPKRRRRPTITP